MSPITLHDHNVDIWCSDGCVAGEHKFVCRYSSGAREQGFTQDFGKESGELEKIGKNLKNLADQLEEIG